MDIKINGCLLDSLALVQAMVEASISDVNFRNAVLMTKVSLSFEHSCCKEAGVNFLLSHMVHYLVPVIWHLVPEHIPIATREK